MGSFLLGALLGAGVALLVAPRSGAETQEEIRGAGPTPPLGLPRSAWTTCGAEMEERLEQARGRDAGGAGGGEGACGGGSGVGPGGRGQCRPMRPREARDELELRLEQSKAAYRAGVDAARDAARDTRDPWGRRTSGVRGGGRAGLNFPGAPPRMSRWQIDGPGQTGRRPSPAGPWSFYPSPSSSGPVPGLPTHHLMSRALEGPRLVLRIVVPAGPGAGGSSGPLSIRASVFRPKNGPPVVHQG